VKTQDTVRMANQIADFFAPYPRDEAIAGVAGHIRSFWEARMLAALYAHRDSGGAGLHPLVVAAIDQVLRPVSTR
jgi:formate dehydrogenase subunit delta